jgi:hypothetical protein
MAFQVINGGCFGKYIWRPQAGYQILETGYWLLAIMLVKCCLFLLDSTCTLLFRLAIK